MKIVIMEPLGINDSHLNELLSNLIKVHEVTTYKEKTTDVDEMIERAKDADILVIANNPLPGIVIESCPNLKMISVAFVGIDHIDQEVCQKRNITISNAAGYCDHAVAELAIGLTLSVLRNIPRCDQATRQFSTKAGLVGHELYGKTFGIIGTGAIGLKTAEIAKAFGCDLIAYSRTQKDNGLNYVDLNTLMSSADIISIHTPLTSETKGLIGRDELDLMKPNAILINTARGPIVDNSYLSYCLSEGKIAGAGVDVFDIEPPLREEDILTNNETAVLTPHVAFATHESILRRAAIVIENIEAWFEGEPQNVML